MVFDLKELSEVCYCCVYYCCDSVAVLTCVVSGVCFVLL